ncbi:hypothetical protein Taro_055028, partial [Colocasia esculenta]|nr:hypothetical protein [Colocasia esculenta]
LFCSLLASERSFEESLCSSESPSDHCLLQFDLGACLSRPGGIQGVVPFWCEGRPGGIQGVVPFWCEGRPGGTGRR